MCLKTLMMILNDPLKAVKQASKVKIGHVLLILLLAWGLIGFGLFMVSVKVFSLIVAFAIGTIGFVAGALLTVFFAYLLTRVMNIIGARGKFINAITILAYSLFPVSVAIIITSMLAFVHSALGVIGFIVIAIQVALSLSLFFRMMKDLFRTNMINVLVGFFIIVYVIMASVYLTVSLSSADLYSFFGEMMIPLFGI